MGERFKEVVNRYKRNNNVDAIDNDKVKSEMLSMLKGTMSFEQNNKKALEKLAVDMVREEFDMDEDMEEIEIHYAGSEEKEMIEKIMKDKNIFRYYISTIRILTHGDYKIITDKINKL